MSWWSNPERARERRWPGIPGLFDFLHTSKRSVTQGNEEHLVRAADIVVAGADFPVLPARQANPNQVVVTISLFGTSGPWVGRAATEFTLQAACGSTGGRGFPDSTPLAAGGRVGEWLTGTYAAVGALAAWWRADHTGLGGHVDVSVLDCMAIGMVTFPSVFAEFAASCGRPPMTASSRRIEVPSVEPTADGWVNFTTNSAQQFADFSVLIGHPEIGDDERYVRATPRFEHRNEFWEMTRAYTRPADLGHRSRGGGASAHPGGARARRRDRAAVRAVRRPRGLRRSSVRTFPPAANPVPPPRPRPTTLRRRARAG